MDTHTTTESFEMNGTQRRYMYVCMYAAECLKVTVESLTLILRLCTKTKRTPEF